MKILVTGGKGQLGRELKQISSYLLNDDWFFSNTNNFDLSNLNNIKSFLDNYNPKIIINCAAYTDVDKAEDDYESANILNHLAVKYIAKWCNINNCRLIHISTDYVFDGKCDVSLDENAMTNPINNYGKTKLFGEIACIAADPNSIIIRTSWLYSSYGDNFVTKMINLMKINKELNIIDDQFGSPTYAADLAAVILSIISASNWMPGIYNFTNEAKISWFDFAYDIKEMLSFTTHLRRVKSKDYLAVARRPKYTLLDKTKIKKTFNVKLTPYKDSLRKCIEIIKKYQSES